MRRRTWTMGIGAVGLGIATLALGLEVMGHDAAAAFTALWQGAFGSWYAITSATLVRSVPLIIIGLGIALAFRAGAFNIGAEGQFYAGAIAATWVGLHAAPLPAPVALLVAGAAAGLAGAAWVALPVLLRSRYGVTEVISTLVLNFVAESLVSLMVQGPLQESQGIYPQSDMIARPAWLPVLVQSEVGYRNLLRLLSRAYLGSEITSAPELRLADLEEFAGDPAPRRAAARARGRRRALVSVRADALGLPAPRRRCRPPGRRGERQD